MKYGNKNFSAFYINPLYSLLSWFDYLDAPKILSKCIPSLVSSKTSIQDSKP